MSRIGEMPIALPHGANVAVGADKVTIEGPKGRLEQALHPGIDVRVDDGIVTLHRAGSGGPARARHGLARALLATRSSA